MAKFLFYWSFHTSSNVLLVSNEISSEVPLKKCLSLRKELKDAKYQFHIKRPVLVPLPTPWTLNGVSNLHCLTMCPTSEAASTTNAAAARQFRSLRTCGRFCRH